MVVGNNIFLVVMVMFMIFYGYAVVLFMRVSASLSLVSYAKFYRDFEF